VEPGRSTRGPGEYERSLLDCLFEAVELYMQAPTVEEKLTRGEECQASLRSLEDYLVTARVSDGAISRGDDAGKARHKDPTDGK
jgi:hypothetical protein